MEARSLAEMPTHVNTGANGEVLKRRHSGRTGSCGRVAPAAETAVAVC